MESRIENQLPVLQPGRVLVRCAAFNGAWLLKRQGGACSEVLNEFTQRNIPDLLAPKRGLGTASCHQYSVPWMVNELRWRSSRLISASRCDTAPVYRVYEMNRLGAIA
jgi:hypothetical protein